MNDFEIENGVLKAYHGDNSDVIIPEGVTRIGGWAFKNCTFLTSITIPEGVTIIGSDAFYECTCLHSVTLPESLTVIHDRAFAGCSALESIQLPEGIREIRYCAFSGSGLKSIRLPDSITKLEWAAFSGCAELTDITLPKGLTKIEYEMFRDCSRLKSVTLPEGITEIESEVFKNCTSLETVVLPEGIEDIRYGVFAGCTSLKSITIPKSLIELGSDDGYEYEEEAGAFEDCINLERIILLGYEWISSYSFRNCPKLKIQYHQYTFTPDITGEVNIDSFINFMYYRNFRRSDVFTTVEARLLFEMYLSAPDEEDVITCIRKHIQELVKKMIDVQDIGIIRAVLDASDFFNQENIDELIQYAIDKKAHEIQLMLTDYKAGKIGYESIEKTIEKKFKL